MDEENLLDNLNERNIQIAPRNAKKTSTFVNQIIINGGMQNNHRDRSYDTFLARPIFLKNTGSFFAQ
jgi:hypothetical protein